MNAPESVRPVPPRKVCAETAQNRPNSTIFSAVRPLPPLQSPPSTLRRPDSPHTFKPANIPRRGAQFRLAACPHTHLRRRADTRCRCCQLLSTARSGAVSWEFEVSGQTASHPEGFRRRTLGSETHQLCAELLRQRPRYHHRPRQHSHRQNHRPKKRRRRRSAHSQHAAVQNYSITPLNDSAA